MRLKRRCALAQVIDGQYHCITVSLDGKLRVDFGPDDQRPDEDKVTFFRPICVEWYMVTGELWDYVNYCGRCRQKIGSLGQTDKFCPRCGAGIAHFIFAMGTVKWKSISWEDDLPDMLTNALILKLEKLS